MATAPVKSQPLHNFSFPFLKWGTTTAEQHNTTSAVPPAAASASANITELDSDNNKSNNNNASETDSAPTRVPTRVGSRSSRPHRSSFTSFLQKPLAKPKVLPPRPHREVSGLKQNDEILTEEQRQQGEEEEDEEEEETEEEEEEDHEEQHQQLQQHQQQQQQQQRQQQQEDLQLQKPWNLRPRKAVNNRHNETVVALPVLSSVKEGNSRQQRDREGNSMMRLRGSVVVEGGGDKSKENNNTNRNNSNGNKNKKTKFWIALSREEIEEDIIVMTGSRPLVGPRTCRSSSMLAYESSMGWCTVDGVKQSTKLKAATNQNL